MLILGDQFQDVRPERDDLVAAGVVVVPAIGSTLRCREGPTWCGTTGAAAARVARREVLFVEPSGFLFSRASRVQAWGRGTSAVQRRGVFGMVDELPDRGDEKVQHPRTQLESEDDDLVVSLAALSQSWSAARLSLEDLLTEVAVLAVQAIPGADGAGSQQPHW